MCHKQKNNYIHNLNNTIMNALVNRVQLIGRMGADIEIKTTTTGKKFGKFSLATTEVTKNEKGEKQEDTQWHNIVVWNPAVEVLEKYTKKGSKIMVEGKLVHRDYEVQGVKKYITEIDLKDVVLMDSKRD